MEYVLTDCSAYNDLKITCSQGGLNILEADAEAAFNLMVSSMKGGLHSNACLGANKATLECKAGQQELPQNLILGTLVCSRLTMHHVRVIYWLVVLAK